MPSTARFVLCSRARIPGSRRWAAFAACAEHGNGGRIQVCVITVSHGWGSVHRRPAWRRVAQHGTPRVPSHVAAAPPVPFAAFAAFAAICVHPREVFLAVPHTAPAPPGHRCLSRCMRSCPPSAPGRAEAGGLGGAGCCGPREKPEPGSPLRYGKRRRFSTVHGLLPRRSDCLSAHPYALVVSCPVRSHRHRGASRSEPGPVCRRRGGRCRAGRTRMAHQ